MRRGGGGGGADRRTEAGQREALEEHVLGARGEQVGGARRLDLGEGPREAEGIRGLKVGVGGVGELDRDGVVVVVDDAVMHMEARAWVRVRVRVKGEGGDVRARVRCEGKGHRSGRCHRC